MKRRILFLIFSLSAFQLIGQGFEGGLRFGLCGSQVDGDQLSGFNKVGVLAGAYVSRKLSEAVSLQMEMVFIQKGSRKPIESNNSFYRLRVHYLEIPLLVKYKVTKKLSLTAGPSFGTLAFSAEDDEYGVYPNPIPFKKFELAGNLGVVYALSDQWSFDARYSNSINTIRPFPGKYHPFFEKGQYNVLIEFSLLLRL